MKEFENIKIIDLSYQLAKGMPVYPGDPAFDWESIADIGIQNCNVKKIILGTHTGTHTDARSHFIENGEALDQINPYAYIGNAIVCRISKGECEYITIDDFKSFDSRIKEGSRIIIDTGWGVKHRDIFTNYSSDEKKIESFFLNGPRISLEAASYLAEKKILLLAIDMGTPNPDDNVSVHKMLLGNNIALIETVANLDKIKNYDEVFISALPLNIKDADGFPIRFTAIVPQE